MPYTFAHPAAVLPLRRFCPDLGVFAALIVGSMTPDLGYFVGAYELAFHAHSARGLVPVCLPLGVLCYFLALVLYKPVTRLLPSPHRQALTALKPLTVPKSLKAVLTLAAALIVGAATHDAWDAFTHRTSFLAHHWPLLRAPVFSLDRATFEVTEVLQHISSVFGLVMVAMVYARWLKKVTADDPPPGEDRWRYALIGLLLVAALVLALPLSLWNTGGDPVHPNLIFLMTRYAVAATALFCGSFILVALVLWPMKR